MEGIGESHLKTLLKAILSDFNVSQTLILLFKVQG